MRGFIFGTLASSFFLGGCSLFSADDDSGVGGEVQSWCQVDDAGLVERERQKRKLTNTSIGEIKCSEGKDARQLPDELILPMPCGRRMVFRAVRLSIADPLDGETAIFGDPNAGDDFRKSISGPWFGEVAGGFSEQSNGAGSTTYYVAKYELTEPQYQIFSSSSDTDYSSGSEACKRSSEALKQVKGTNVQPATGLSWFDAVGFADRYSRWLIALETDNGGLGSILPAREARPGFVRLPTEVEWEFAARGGDETGSGGKSYEVADGWGDGDGPAPLSEIAWYSGVGQEPPDGRRTYPVGRKAPNRLHLFDMVGNAEEFTMDYFRPVRPDGSLVGRPGGIVVRGGGALDDVEMVGVGARREMELYTDKGALSSPTIGVRLVISAPYFVNRRGDNGEEMQGNPEFRDRISAAWLVRANGGGSEGSSERGTAMRLIEQLRAAQAPNDESNSKLAAIEREIALASSKAAEAEARSAEELFLSALMSAGYAHEHHGKIKQLEALIADASIVKLTAEQEAGINQIKSELPANKRERSSTLAYYYANVISLSRRPKAQIEGAERVISDRLRRAGLSRLIQMLPTLSTHIDEARRGIPSTERQKSWFVSVLRSRK